MKQKEEIVGFGEEEASLYILIDGSARILEDDLNVARQAVDSRFQWHHFLPGCILESFGRHVPRGHSDRWILAKRTQDSHLL